MIQIQNAEGIFTNPRHRSSIVAGSIVLLGNCLNNTEKMCLGCHCTVFYSSYIAFPICNSTAVIQEANFFICNASLKMILPQYSLEFCFIHLGMYLCPFLILADICLSFTKQSLLLSLSISLLLLIFLCPNVQLSLLHHVTESARMARSF